MQIVASLLIVLVNKAGVRRATYLYLDSTLSINKNGDIIYSCEL